MNQPLAERMRPQKLGDYIGQQHLIGPKALFRKNIDSNMLHSFILWGPPGVGKTTLAKILANELERPFFTLSAIASGVKEVREVIQKAKQSQFFNTKSPILFIDEIHRFNKAQQDSLLGAVESGTITLIGATTENPSFEVISALLSRCQVYVLQPLEKEHLQSVLERAIKEDTELSKLKIELKECEALFRYSGGDARKLLNALEIVVHSAPNKDVKITNEFVYRSIQENLSKFDKQGEMHYDVISAFIKSIRGSDPNAAVYWLARMIEGGEDPKFIARRLLILASEDVGLANPTAMVMANGCFDAIHKIGWPESRIILSQMAIYLATSPKSNSAYEAINMAQQEVKETGDLSVPLHLRNAPTKLMKDLGYGANYKYAHGFEGNFVDQDYLPDHIVDKRYYSPGKNKREQDIQQFLEKRWQKKYKS